MRYSLTFALLMLSVLQLAAQQYEYVPMVVPGTVWQTVNVHPRSGPPHNIVACYPTFLHAELTNRDTFAYGQTSKVMMARKKVDNLGVSYGVSCPFPGTGTFIADDADYPYMMLREVDKKVYNQYSDLLFDFNLEVGQGGSYMGTVTGIDTVQVGNHLRKRFFVTYQQYPDTIIEGIGSLRRGIHLHDVPHINYRLLSCYAVNGQVLYSHPQYPCGALLPWGTFTGIAEQAQTTISVYPNPFAERVTIEAQEQLRAEIYNNMGTKVFAADVNKTAVLELSHLPDGIYLLLLRDATGTVRSTEKLVKAL